MAQAYKLPLIMLPRKSQAYNKVTVPQTDTGRWEEHSKVLE